MSHDRDSITSVEVWPVDVPLTDRFVISRGSLAAAESAFVRVGLAGGSSGFGEIAPFAALTGETREKSARVAARLGGSLVGARASRWKEHAAALKENAPGEAAARAGIECALVDALARSRSEPLYRWFGGADVRARETDITIPILDDARVDRLAEQWHARGFRVFKLKVGDDADEGLRRVERLAGRYPEVRFILDANQGFDLQGARELIRGLAPWRQRLCLLEQPLPRDDVEGMAALRAGGAPPIAADEAVFTLGDARRVIAAGAADCVNLKIMKSGLAETIAIAQAVRRAGLDLMIGGMMETRLGMSFSYALVLGLGGIRYLDLDTPLLMAEDPLEGGYSYDGPRMSVWDGAGIDARPRVQPVVT